MATTKSIVDDNILLVDGAASNDATVISRWTRAVQRAVNYVWNDRPWPFKLKTNSAFAFNSAAPVSLPTDFGSVEAEGAGIYCLSPKAPLRVFTIGEYNMAKLGTAVQTQAFGVWTRWAIGAGTLELWPTLSPANATMAFVYLRRTPTCVYENAPSLDELSWIPTQWHDLISDGARWLNAHDIASSQETSEQAFTKLGLDQMRAREIQTGQGFIVPFMRNRRNR